jgi:AcrR family transcriptional regulator
MPMPAKGASRVRTPGKVEHSRRSELLDAAIAVIADRGIEGLRTREIASRAGVNISTLHYYFATKEILLLAVLRRTIERVAPSSPESSVQGHAQDELHAQLIGTLRGFHENPHLAAVLQELRLRSRRDAHTRKAFRTLHAEWNHVVAGTLRRAIAKRRVRRDVDATSGALIITAFIMGIVLQLWVDPKACDFLVVSAELERWLAYGSARVSQD